MYIPASLREDFVHDYHTSTGTRGHGYAVLRTTCSFHETYNYTLLLQLAVTALECYHARLGCFVFETNQHFVGSARIAGLCLPFRVHMRTIFILQAEVSWSPYVLAGE